MEVHLYPNRRVHNLTELTAEELDDFAALYRNLLGRFDRIYDAPLPYMAALHQYRDSGPQADGYFHVELMSIRRSATKLKYLAASESAMDAFIADVVATNYRQADISAREKAMLDFAVKVCEEPWAVNDADHATLAEHGFDDEDAWDIAAITGLFGLSNRLANATDMRPNPEFYLMGRVPRQK